MVGRLAPVMDSLISSNQYAFIKGRQLVDGVVTVNEIIDVTRKTEKECLIFKVDFEKAYDSVSWSFLDYMMRRLGFSERWCRWIRACVFCGNLSVLVNGCPTKEVNIQRGLKQGDPLAPFLFLLVVEGLSGLVRSAKERSLYQGFKVGASELAISHLQYADDTLFLEAATMANPWALKTILRCFELASGRKVNFSNSFVMGVNVGGDFLCLVERFLYCRVGSVPFTYLGLPVGANPRLEKTWQPLLQLLANRLGSWGNKYVSLEGRVVLLNSVLNAILIFYMSVIKMPVVVWKKIVHLQREFLWGGVKQSRSIPWVSWSVVCQPKCEGGLGVRDLRQVNLALLAKWRLRYLVGDGGIWRDIISARYGGCHPSPHLGSRPSGLRPAMVGWGFIWPLPFRSGFLGFSLCFFYAGLGVCVVSCCGVAAWVPVFFLVFFGFWWCLWAFSPSPLVGLGVYPKGFLVLGVFGRPFGVFVQFYRFYLFIYLYIYLPFKRKEVKRMLKFMHNHFPTVS